MATFDDNAPPDSPSPYAPQDYSLGEPCEDVFRYCDARRLAVVDMGRRMAELTIPEVMPPAGYKTGDNIPGNNQSIGAYCVTNLCSKIMFQGFPPGLPMMTIEAIEYEVQAQIDQQPELWANLILAFAGLERAHRTKLNTTTFKQVYVEYLHLLAIVGNGCWKHVELNCPTFYTPHDYVVRRDRHGHVRHGVVRDRVAIQDLDDATRTFVFQRTPTIRENLENDWVSEVLIYTGVKLVENGEGEVYEWQTWQEYDGVLIPGTELTSDYDTPPLRFDWLIPIPGQDWGMGYCERFRGDLFAAEAYASGLTDGAAIASLMLMMVEPGSMTSIRQIREAKNLSVLPGRAQDITMFRSEKASDLSFVSSELQNVATRLARAFLLQSSIVRSGERVTAEEVSRLGNELDQAMGGLYTSLTQSVDRPNKLRFMRLHEDKNSKLPPLPKGVVEVQVTSGMDSMGRSNEASNLLEFGQGINTVFGPKGATTVLSSGDWTTRYAAAKGISHPSSLVKSDKQQAAEMAQGQQAATQADLMSKAAGPLAGAAGQAMLAQSQPQQPQAPPQ